MSKERLVANPERLSLSAIEQSLSNVEIQWQTIDDTLEKTGIGRKDTPFNTVVRERMMSAYTYLDELLTRDVKPFSPRGIEAMLELNHRIHYGTDIGLRNEYQTAMEATTEKFYQKIEPINDWYDKHKKKNDHPLKIAAEIYVGILGQPQLFIEGNHRTGSIIASWINMDHHYPPFILSTDNAIAYFAPSAEIKHFDDKSMWRRQTQLPKYRKSFLQFWEKHIDEKYIKK